MRQLSDGLRRLYHICADPDRFAGPSAAPRTGKDSIMAHAEPRTPARPVQGAYDPLRTFPSPWRQRAVAACKPVRPGLDVFETDAISGPFEYGDPDETDCPGS